MNDEIEWLSVPEFADRIGVAASRVRDLLRDGALVAVRRGPNSALSLPADYIVPGDHAPHVLATLKGTFTLLKDAGLSDDEVIDWLFSPVEELGATPMATLREGRRAAVRRAAQTLL